jgi:hypothetical protein
VGPFFSCDRLGLRADVADAIKNAEGNCRRPRPSGWLSSTGKISGAARVQQGTNRPMTRSVIALASIGSVRRTWDAFVFARILLKFGVGKRVNLAECPMPRLHF